MKSVIAVFAKTPRPGLVKTRLSPPLTSEEGAELYQCMLVDTVTRVAALQMDLAIFYDGDESFFRAIAPKARLLPQGEGGLGARLINAFAALDTLRYDASVVIGSDAPDLPLAYVEEAVRHVADGADVVFGPADDGGYYLVALKGTHPVVFADIPWSTSSVLADSVASARAAGLTVALLPQWYDVDCYADLSRPTLLDSGNGATLTRGFIRELSPRHAQNG